MPFLDPEKRRLYKKEWNKKYYVLNRRKEMARVKKRKMELRAWLDEYKKNLACEKCGENHIACLDFHHRDASQKDFSVGSIKEFGWGRERVLNEIEKCMVVCANCHRKLHAKVAK
jgi:transcription elongation factor Elf1